LQPEIAELSEAWRSYLLLSIHAFSNRPS
jgi:hypothetical protein